MLIHEQLLIEASTEFWTKQKFLAPKFRQKDIHTGNHQLLFHKLIFIFYHFSTISIIYVGFLNASKRF